MSNDVTIERLNDTYGERNFKEVTYKEQSAFFRRPRLSFFDTLQNQVSQKVQQPFELMENCVEECFVEGSKDFLHNPSYTAYAFDKISDYINDFQEQMNEAKKPLPATKSKKKVGK